MVKRPTPLQTFEAWVQSWPDRYAVAAFRGAGQWAKADVQTFERAVEVARSLYVNRPVCVYAVRGTHQSLILTIDDKTEIIMTFLITWTGGNHSDAMVTPYVNDAAAKAALEALPPERGGAVISSEADINRMSGFTGPSLVSLFNGLCDMCGELGDPPAKVTRFATFGDGARRVYTLVEQLSKGMPVISALAPPPDDLTTPPTQEGVTAMATATATAKKTKEKATNGEGRMGLARPVGKVSDLKPVRDGTGRALVLKAMNGKMTGEQIVKDLKMSTSEVVGYARFFGKIGIGVDVDDKGRVTAVFPGSKTIDDVIVTPKKG